MTEELPEWDGFPYEEEAPYVPHAEEDGNTEGFDTDDLSADGEWLASAGFGTDEDYGSYGGEW